MKKNKLRIVKVAVLVNTMLAIPAFFLSKVIFAIVVASFIGQLILAFDTNYFESDDANLYNE